MKKDKTPEKDNSTGIAIFDQNSIYSKIFHNNPTPHTLAKKSDRSLVDVNEAWEKFTGYEKGEVLGYAVEDLNLICLSEANSIRAFLADQEILKSYELEVNKKNGEITYGLATFQLVNLGGEDFVQSSILDISKLKHTENQLQVSKNFSESLLDSMHEGLIVLNADLTCIRVNKAYLEMTGYKESEIVGTKQPFPHWPPEHYQTFRKYVSLGLKGIFNRSQLTFKKANGDRFEAAVASAKITNNENETIGYVSTLVDISERIKYQNELQERSIQMVRKKDAILQLVNLVGKDFDTILKNITSITSRTLNVARVSIWKFNEDESQIHCIKAFHLDSNSFVNNEILNAEDYPSYFKALYKNKTIKINNAVSDEITKDLAEDYLPKYNISSMLDVFITGIDKPFGVICFEHTGEPRKWTASEEQFATTVAGLVSLAIENNKRTKIQKELIEINEKLSLANTDLKNLKKELEQQNVYLREEINLVFNYEEMVYGSAAFSQVLTDVEKVAETDATVLLLGESGTGKELIARAIHNISERNKKPLIKVNCSAIPKELIESELFGHKKGSFTGAFNDKEGKFKLADGGTLFLDEIGELPLDMQPKLLRAIQEREIEPIGSSTVEKVNLRIVAATNRNLDEEVKKKNFREDLYFRLNVFPIDIPPLRKRPEDIPILIEHFVDKFCRKYNKEIKFISQETKQALYNYKWPGNVRELENLIERSVILTNSETLFVPGFKSSEKEASISSPTVTLDDVQRMHIVQILKQCNWQIDGSQGAAKILDIKPSTLRDRMKKLGIKKP